MPGQGYPQNAQMLQRRKVLIFSQKPLMFLYNQISVSKKQYNFKYKTL